LLAGRKFNEVKIQLQRAHYLHRGVDCIRRGIVTRQHDYFLFRHVDPSGAALGASLRLFRETSSRR
jgi:hypothetical protein